MARIIVITCLLFASTAQAEVIEFDTDFKWLGASHSDVDSIYPATVTVDLGETFDGNAKLSIATDRWVIQRLPVESISSFFIINDDQLARSEETFLAKNEKLGLSLTLGFQPPILGESIDLSKLTDAEVSWAVSSAIGGPNEPGEYPVAWLTARSAMIEDITPSAIPEPSAIALSLLGILGLIHGARKSAKA